MTTERDPRTRTVLSWLRDDAHENAERVLLRALDEVDATPQRRSWWPARGDAQVNLYLKLAVGAAAAMAVVFLGLRLVPTSIGPGTPSPITSPTVAPSFTPLPLSGVVEPGTYVVRAYTSTPFLVTLPAGWSVDLGMIAKGDFFNERTAVLLRPWIVTHVYADACQWQGTMQPVGATKAALVAALTAQTGLDASGPLEATLGGLEATKFILSMPVAFDASACDDGYGRPWPDTGGGEAIWPPMFSGSVSEVFIVETDGKATAIQAAHYYERSSRGDVAELEAVIDSIVFMP